MTEETKSSEEAIEEEIVEESPEYDENNTENVENIAVNKIIITRIPGKKYSRYPELNSTPLILNELPNPLPSKIQNKNG